MTAKTIYYTVLGRCKRRGGGHRQCAGRLGHRPLQTLVILMAVDYVTGVLCALVWKKSPKSTDGAF